MLNPDTRLRGVMTFHTRVLLNACDQTHPASIFDLNGKASAGHQHYLVEQLVRAGFLAGTSGECP